MKIEIDFNEEKIKISYFDGMYTLTLQDEDTSFLPEGSGGTFQEALDELMKAVEKRRDLRGW